jgi:hypothetical protein
VFDEMADEEVRHRKSGTGPCCSTCTARNSASICR